MAAASGHLSHRPLLTIRPINVNTIHDIDYVPLECGEIGIVSLHRVFRQTPRRGTHMSVTYSFIVTHFLFSPSFPPSSTTSMRGNAVAAPEPSRRGRGRRRQWRRRLPSPPAADGVEDDGDDNRSLPPWRWSTMAAATMNAVERERERERKVKKNELTAKSHVQLRLTKTFDRKHDGVV
uniref:Uncharacterized protein n=1 Tax=Oryza nivara TaxID=4536 RepID=A0A0E0H3L5_ORYNI